MLCCALQFKSFALHSAGRRTFRCCLNGTWLRRNWGARVREKTGPGFFEEQHTSEILAVL